MYIPNSFAERDNETLFAFMEAHPLATMVTSDPDQGLFATHLPLLVDRTSGPNGTLFGHIARANPHARLGTELVGALIMFTGPDAYITPAWYNTKKETGRVVPTWNYIAVHVYGSLQLRDDPQFLRPHLEKLTRQHESSRPNPWEVSDAPDDHIVQQMKAIVGVEVRIDRIEGKWKMSQNRTAADIDGVIQGLNESGSAEAKTVAEIVEARRPH